jgi:molecular chaperone DnaK
MKQKKYQDQDEQKKHAAEAKNKAENIIYELEKQLNENKSISQTDRDELTTGINELKNVLSTNNAKDIEAKIQSLQAISSRVFYSGQQQQQQQQQQQNNQNNQNNDGPSQQ